MKSTMIIVVYLSKTAKLQSEKNKEKNIMRKLLSREAVNFLERSLESFHGNEMNILPKNCQKHDVRVELRVANFDLIGCFGNFVALI